MANRVIVGALEEISALYNCGAMGNWSDSQLIAQFLAGHEGKEAAFRVLIHRHGPMVLGVCRRVLGDEHAAEDAFQSTFIVFVKKAARLRDAHQIAGWLYGVALRVSRKERTKAARRRSMERQVAATVLQAGEDPAHAELRSVIDEEIRRLPERFRLPLVLCHLQGLRHDEVARRLGCPVGTVESRLSRARSRLRKRLSRRGLPPSASALSALLRYPCAPQLGGSLVSRTIQCAGSGRAAGSLSLLGWSALERLKRIVPASQPGGVFAATATAACVGVALGLTVYRPDDKSSARALPPLAEPPALARFDAAVPQLEPLLNKRAAPGTFRPNSENSTSAPIARAKPRIPSARAMPLAAITVDGRLDDWPTNLDKYEIKNQLQTNPGYHLRPVQPAENPNAYFMAGYDQRAERIYLAVFVRDRDVVVHPSDTLKTDAVEVYIEGAPSESAVGAIPGLPAAGSRRSGGGRGADPFGLDSSNNWRASLDASTMPVLQYAGVPGNVAAYGDPWHANPSLVYARAAQTDTTMKFHHARDVTTYEWSIRPYDRFPDRPAQIYPGRRLGLEVAVVDKDADAHGRISPPLYLTWGSPPTRFKGVDETSLGELVIAGP